MKLLIISNMAHYYRDSELVGHGPTAREISYLGEIFTSVVHIGCLHEGKAPKLFLPYKLKDLRFVPLPPTGGPNLKDKLNILRHIPLYVRAMLRELQECDVVHVRGPANIPLIAIVLLAFVRRPKTRWIKFAGNWKPDKPDALSYRFQRWWLQRGWHRGYVTVNGEWPDLPPFFRSFINPCLTDAQLQRGREVATSKQLELPIKVLYVGRVETAKGVGRILEIASQLHVKKISFEVDIVGDGPERSAFESQASQLRIADMVRFYGWLARDEIDELYEECHIFLFPSSASEGWPKVLSEAMAFGAVPITSNISSIPFYLENAQAGRAYAPDDLTSCRDQILAYLRDPMVWKTTSENAVRLAERFSYNNYLADVRRMLEIE